MRERGEKKERKRARKKQSNHTSKKKNNNKQNKSNFWLMHMLQSKTLYILVPTLVKIVTGSLKIFEDLQRPAKDPSG